MATPRAESSWTAEQCARLLNKAIKSPTGWKACCPAHEDRNPSLFLADGADGLALRCYAGCDYKAIVEALRSRGAVIGSHEHDTDGLPTEFPHLGPYSNHWDYRDAYGRVVARICRWEKGNGDKEIRPLSLGADGKWHWKQPAHPRPLFNLDRLTNEPERPVILVEGEKTAVAAQRLFPGYIATTWIGGSQAMGQTSPTPLERRDIVLVPDNDKTGRGAMKWWATALKSTAKSLALLDPGEIDNSLSDGWDLADALHEGRDVSDWIAQAKRLSVVGGTAEAVAAIRVRTLAEIMSAPVEDRFWVFDQILPAGAFLIVGRPKVGKSWLLFQMLIAAAMGGSLLGYSSSGSHHGLGIFAEDDAARVQSRFARYRLSEVPSGITLILRDELSLLAAEHGLVDTFAQFLDKYLAGHPQTKVVMIDTESTVRMVWDQCHVFDETQHKRYERDVTRRHYAETREFDEVALKHNVFIGLVNHTGKRKQAKWQDIHELINRTNTAMAGASGSIVLADRPNASLDDEAEDAGDVKVLGIRGRDIKGEHLLAVRQDQYGVYQSLGRWYAQKQTENERQIMATLEEMSADTGDADSLWHSSRAIASYMGSREGNVQKALGRMVKAGRVNWKHWRVETKQKKGVRLVVRDAAITDASGNSDANGDGAAS